MMSRIGSDVVRRLQLLLANALSVQASLYTINLSNGHVHLLRNRREQDIPIDSLQPAMGMAELAMKIYIQAGQLEGEIRTKLLLADLFLLAKQSEAAKNLAESVYPKAQAMGYALLTQWAQDHLSDETPYHKIYRFLESVADETDEGWDRKVAVSSDDDMRKSALDILTSSGLPIERLPVVEREAFSMRKIARERLSYCRYIELNQNLEHTDQIETFYATDPQQFCICLKLHYRSAVESIDTNALISDFKQEYCKGCADRSPFQS